MYIYLKSKICFFVMVCFSWTYIQATRTTVYHKFSFLEGFLPYQCIKELLYLWKIMEIDNKWASYICTCWKVLKNHNHIYSKQYKNWWWFKMFLYHIILCILKSSHHRYPIYHNDMSGTIPHLYGKGHWKIKRSVNDWHSSKISEPWITHNYLWALLPKKLPSVSTLGSR